MTVADKKSRQFVIDLLFRDRDCSRANTEDVSVSKVLEILRENKVPLVHILPSNGEKFSFLTEKEAFEEQYNREKAELDLQRNKYLLVRERFQLAGIEDILIKSTGDFPYKSSNLDVLVKKEKMSAARKLLIEMGYVELRNMEEPYKYLFRKFTRGKSISAIHLHEKIAWITPFHNEDEVWGDYRRSPDDDFIDLPSIEDSILIITAHWFYENKDLKLCDLANVYNLLKKGTVDWEKMRDAARLYGWAKGFNLCTLIYAELFKRLLIETNLIPEQILSRAQKELPACSGLFLKKGQGATPPDFPLRFPKVHCKLLHYKQAIRDRSEKGLLPKIKSLFLLTKYAIKVKLKWSYQVPFLVSFSGMDGCGKTTHARSLQKCFDICGIRNVYVWSRVGSSRTIKALSVFKRLLPLGDKDNGRSSVADAIKSDADYRSRKTSFLKLVYVSVLLTEMVIQYFWRVTLPLLCRKVVICDRYVLDTIAEIYCRSYDSCEDVDKKLPAKILRVLTLRSNKAYLLEIPYDLACDEKEENRMDCGQISRQMTLYHKMAGSFKLDTIAARADFGILSSKVSCEVLNSYYKRFR